MMVVDTSVWFDLFSENLSRREIAEKVLEVECTVYEPEVFKVELAGVLSRKFMKDEVLNFIDEITSKIRITENPNELAFQISLNTGCRAIDAYFIATARITNSILITNDRTMAKNAKKYGIEAYYLIDEFDEAMERVRNG